MVQIHWRAFPLERSMEAVKKYPYTKGFRFYINVYHGHQIFLSEMFHDVTCKDDNLKLFTVIGLP